MTFADVGSGESAFVDANAFIYAYMPEPVLGPPSFRFLERIAMGEIHGFTSTHVLSDVSHRLMLLEACATFGWPVAGAVGRLKRDPLRILQLGRFRQAIDEIIATGIRMIPIEAQQISTAAELSRQHGLLGGDALILAMMKSQGLTNLASNDADFDRIPDLVRFTPL